MVLMATNTLSNIDLSFTKVDYNISQQRAKEVIIIIFLLINKQVYLVERRNESMDMCVIIFDHFLGFWHSFSFSFILSQHPLSHHFLISLSTNYHPIETTY
jgi:hypothetical protein